MHLRHFDLDARFFDLLLLFESCCRLTEKWFARFWVKGLVCIATADLLLVSGGAPCVEHDQPTATQRTAWRTFLVVDVGPVRFKIDFRRLVLLLIFFSHVCNHRLVWLCQHSLSFVLLKSWIVGWSVTQTYFLNFSAWSRKRRTFFAVLIWVVFLALLKVWTIHNGHTRVYVFFLTEYGIPDVVQSLIDVVGLKVVRWYKIVFNTIFGHNFEAGLIVAFDLLLFSSSFLVFDLWKLVEVFCLTRIGARLNFNNPLIRFLRHIELLSLGLCPS